MAQVLGGTIGDIIRTSDGAIAQYILMCDLLLKRKQYQRFYRNTGGGSRHECHRAVGMAGHALAPALFTVLASSGPYVLRSAGSRKTM